MGRLNVHLWGADPQPTPSHAGSGLLEPTPQLAMEVVAEATGIELDDILGPSQSTSVTRARRVAMAVARRTTHCSYPELGRAFNHRDHKTVMSAVRHVEADERDQVLARRVEQLVWEAVEAAG